MIALSTDVWQAVDVAALIGLLGSSSATISNYTAKEEGKERGGGEERRRGEEGRRGGGEEGRREGGEEGRR